MKVCFVQAALTAVEAKRHSSKRTAIGCGGKVRARGGGGVAVGKESPA